MSKKRKIKRTNRHHRLSRSRTGGKPFDGKINGVSNVAIVDYRQHQAFHTLFPDTYPPQIAMDLNTNWVDPNFVIVAIRKQDARKILKHLSQIVHPIPV